MPPRACRALLNSATDQLRNSTSRSVVNVSQLSANRRLQQSGLVVCVHGGDVYFQLNDPSMKHAWHGDIDRIWGALQSVFQTIRIMKFRGTKCFQFSGRDDQKQTIAGVGDGFGLPAMVWHLGSAKEPGDSVLLETSVVPWPRDYRPEACCKHCKSCGGKHRLSSLRERCTRCLDKPPFVTSQHLANACTTC